MALMKGFHSNLAHTALLHSDPHAPHLKPDTVLQLEKKYLKTSPALNNVFHNYWFNLFTGKIPGQATKM